ncbi:hypothetical protein ACLM5J_04625 [Nocardioides sp. Bht2]|uniref:hypothetical protein n=1 Tax=Nocardioides sp. Bht2 TaxID=3392297 RepID=UPI0039B3CC1B
MGALKDRMQSLLHWPGKKRERTPAERKQEGRWEGEGGALHPTDEPPRHDPPSEAR